MTQRRFCILRHGKRVTISESHYRALLARNIQNAHQRLTQRNTAARQKRD